MRSLAWITWIILWTHKGKPPLSYRNQMRNRAENTHCQQALGHHQEPTWVGAHLSPVSQILCIHFPLDFWSASFQPSAFNLVNWYSPLYQSPTTKFVLTNTSKSHPSSHIISLTSISAFNALQKVHPPFFLWYCTVTADPAPSSPLISALQSIYPTYTSGAFPAAGFLSSAPAGKSSSICEQSKVTLQI